MACWSHQSRNAKALRCGQTNGLASTAYSLKTTAITPVSSTYGFKRTKFLVLQGPQIVPDCRSLCASWRVNGLERSLSTV